MLYLGIVRVIVGIVKTGIIRDRRGQIGIGNWTRMNRMKEGSEREDRRNEVRLMWR
jgi:hypothetical protein